MSSTGTAASAPYSSVARRVAAYAIDAGVVVLALGLSLVLGVTTVPGILLMLLGTAYAVLMWLGVGLKGHTPGMRVVGLRVAGAETGQPIGLGAALARQLVLGLLGPVNIVQLFLIGKQERHQGWHDRVANSVVYDGAPSDQAAAQPGATPPVAATVRPSLATGASPSIGPMTTAPARGGAVIGPPPGMIPPPPAPAAPQTAPAPSTPTPPAPSAAPAPGIAAPPSAPPPEPRHQTMVPTAAPADREPVSATVISPRATAAKPAGAVTWKLRGAAGVERVIADLVLAGRDPDTALVPGAAGWSLQDPELTVSKTHALFGLADGSVWVEDWHSTNGVLLRRGGEENELPPHERTPLHAGDEVLLGDFALTVEEIR